jgi:predicted nucleic acid-binding protein
MIVFDTNVLSEPLKSQPNAEVLQWIVATDEAATTAVSVGELIVGVRRLSAGRRREGLQVAIEQTLTSFSDKILPYDEAAARSYAELQERRRSVGAPLSVEDGMIAAICVCRSLLLATRNIRDFQGLGLDLINPWDAGAR